MKPLLILVDGISGSGKDAQILTITNFFNENKYEPHIFKEPSEFLGDFIFEYRKLPEKERDPYIETFLFTASRKYLLDNKIKSVLDKPNTASILIRNYLSNYVYQSLQGMPLEKIIQINDFYPQHDLALILLCEPEIAYKRITDRATKRGIQPTQNEVPQKLRLLKERYESIAKIIPNTKIVKTDGSKKAVGYQIRSHLKNILNIPMEKAIFLDKDGTLVDNSGYPYTIPSEKIYFKNTVEGLKKLQDNRYKLIIISSQPWVARERLTENEVKNIFESIVCQYKNLGIKIDGYYYCLHPRSEKCNCKKPNTGLLEQAVELFNIDISRSFMIGDMDIDIEMGRNFGLTTCLVRTGNGKEYNSPIKPNHIAIDVNEAANLILNQ